MKIDQNGWEYYDKLPEDFRLATIDDFSTNGKRNIGMLFLIRWATKLHYFQICYVSMNLTAKFIEPFIKDERVFVKD